ncbi:hypothetical protein [Fodinicola acaciae]|uniref:hypothetical protein n=1 Tax=Fodinicola acaciae TaxID=2681555 RepID=UPI0013D6A161|nr:hypothetical protein [Fodinicola acaciae]
MADLSNAPDAMRGPNPAIATMTARAAARVYAALAGDGEIDGFRLLSKETIDEATAVRTTAFAPVLGGPVPKSYGFFHGHDDYEMGSRVACFGMNGSGVSLAFADRDHRFSFAFTHNRLTAGPGDNAGRIVGVVRDALGVPDRG